MTTTPDPTPTPETPMTDPTRPDDGWPAPALVLAVLRRNWPAPGNAADIAADDDRLDRHAVEGALEHLEQQGRVQRHGGDLPSGPPAVWSLAGQEREEATRHAEAFASAQAAAARFRALSDAAGNPGAPGHDEAAPPADTTCGWQIAPDTPCGVPATGVVWGDDGDEARFVCDQHYHEAIATGWAAAGPELPASGCICGPRGDGTGPYDGDPHPDCPEHGAVYDTPVDEPYATSGTPSGRGDRPPSKATPIGALSYAIGHAEQTVGPGVSIAASDVLAGLAELGWVARPRVPGMDDPVEHHPGLHTTRARFDRVDAKLDTIAGQLDQLLTVPVVTVPAGTRSIAIERTLSAMDRVTQVDAEQVIYDVLTADDGPGTRHGEPLAHRLAERIAEALYGPTTELAPVTTWEQGTRVTQPTYGAATVNGRHLDRVHVTWDTDPGSGPAAWISAAVLVPETDEGAPTEVDPLPDDIEDIAADPDRQHEIPYLPTAADYARGHTRGDG